MLLYLQLLLFYRTNRPHNYCLWVYKLNKPNYWEITQKSQKQVLNKLLECSPNWFYHARKPMEKAAYFLKNAYLWFIYPLNKNLWSRIRHNILIISCCFPCNSMNSEICFKSAGSNKFPKLKNLHTLLCFAVEVKVVILGFCVVAT